MSKHKAELIDVKNRITLAREAATLLYRGLAKEYKQAKIMAAKNIGTKKLPDNFEIALELDKIAEEIEGPSRNLLIMEMREKALELMNTLKEYNPKLIGSVWRGTVTKNSDLDIIVYANDSNHVVKALKLCSNEIIDKRWVKVNLDQTIRSFLNIKVGLNNGKEAEIIVREIEDQDISEKCDTYGDLKTGLSREQLIKVLKKDPLKKFIPLRKSKVGHQ
ncbi:MAG: nucleotidyltransferase domain-containing protein [Candidatus Bathyarchaeota archaeon]|nr:nucleotidyltransferase domain-containing protein [Candidatus Bathyarchaeota archaeon]